MLAGSLSAIRGLIKSGAIQSRTLTGKLISLSKSKGVSLRGVKEYGDKGTEFEELRLARLFQRYLRVNLREQILRKAKNAPFTKMMKGFDKPLYEASRLIDEFVHIRKMTRGYRVGFSLGDMVNSRMNVRGLLQVLEKGVILDKSEEAAKKMRRYFFKQMRLMGVDPGDIGIPISESKGRRKGKRGKYRGRYRIPPRPFFKLLAERFVKVNQAERREFTIGEYSLHIFVRKKPKVNINDLQTKKKGSVIFQELYG